MAAAREEVGALRDSIETTQSVYAELISRPRLTPQLLEKPPVKFIRDIFIEVSLATGCGQGLFTAEEIENAASSRERKFQFLAMLIHFVAVAVDEPMLMERVRVSKVAAGLEPENTNLLLQELQRAATHKSCHRRYATAIEAARQAHSAGRAGAWSPASVAELTGTPERKSFELPDYSTPIPSPAAAYAAAMQAAGAEPASSSRPPRKSGSNYSSTASRCNVEEAERQGSAPSNVLAGGRLSHKSLSAAGEWIAQIPDTRLRMHAMQWYEAQPLPREEENWRKLLLAEGLSGLEDGRLGRLAYAVAQFDKAARKVMEIAEEEGYLGRASENELQRMILRHIWPGVPSLDEQEAEPEAECSPEEPTPRKPEKHQSGNKKNSDAERHLNADPHCVVMSKREYVCDSIKQACDTKRRSLITRSSSLNCADKQEDTVEEDSKLHPFIRACNGHTGSELIDAVKDLLEKETFDLQVAVDTTGVTALLYAVSILKSPGVVKLLVDYRADVRTSYQGLEVVHGLQPGATAIEFATARKKEHIGHKGIERWEAIEEILKAEVDRLRGWQTGRRNTRQMTWSKNRIQELEARVNAAPSSSSSDESDDDVHVSSLKNQSRPAEGTRGSKGKGEMMRSLYHAKAGFLVEHIEAHPSELYELEDKVGEGAFGSVRKCIFKNSGAVRALKTLPKMFLEDLSLWSEIGIMRQIDHPHIMKLFQTFEDTHNVYMVCEMCTGGQLFDAIIEAGTFSERLSAAMMKQMLSSVCYLHQRCICHRDLKPENFMLASPGPLDRAHVKLIDFGTAKRFDLDPMTTKVCTVHYVAPDLLKNQPVPYTEKCDVWSCGVILYVMLSGSPPFVGDTDMDVLKKVKKGIYHFTPTSIWDDISNDAHRMIMSMLTVKVKDRYSAEQAANDKWVSELAPHAREVSLTEKRVLDKMRAFHAFNKLKKVALQVIAQQLSDESITLLRQMFMALDPEMKGALMLDKMEDAVTKLTQRNEVDADQAVELIQMMHEMAGSSGEINYTQFLAANIDRGQYLREEACKAAFALFDVDGDGEISREDLRALFANPQDVEDGQTEGDEAHLGQHAMEILHRCDRPEIERILQEVDGDGNGSIDFTEFMKMMSSKDADHPADHGLHDLQQELKSPASRFSSNQGRLSKEHVTNAEADKEERKKKLQKSPTVILEKAKMKIAQEEAAKQKSAPSSGRPSSRQVARTDDDASREVQKPVSKMIKSATVVFGAKGRRTVGKISGGDGIPDDDHPHDKKRSSVVDATRGHEHRCSVDGGVHQHVELPGPNPIWEVLKEKHIDMVRLEACLKGEGGRYANCHLNREEGVPPALFLAVTVRSPEMVKLLIVNRTDVRRKYDGEKPWRTVKVGQTPQDVNDSQKGRFKGTVLGERCEAIGTLLQAEEDRLRGWRSGRRASEAAKRYFQRADAEARGAAPGARLSICDVESEELETLKQLASKQTSEMISKTEEAMAKKTLYSAEATFVCEHIDGTPADFYKIGSQVGEGTFGSVCKVWCKQTKLVRAMKSVPKSLLEESDLWQEIELMRDIDHPYITRLYGTYEDAESIFMIMECCDGGELFDAIESAGCFVESTTAKLFQQMLIAISYLHNKMICHRDLKPENFLLQREGPVERTCVKLIDFGTARRFGPDIPMTTKICTIHYVAPEILARNATAYTEKCDCWSLGVCLYLTLCGSPPFSAETDTQVLKKVRKGKFRFEPEFFWDSIGEAAKSLISSLLVVDASVRFSANDALRHHWFRTLERHEPDPKVLKQVVPNLLKFKRYSWFKQKSMELIANQLPELSCEDLRDVFLKFDSNNYGKIRHADLVRAVPTDAEDPRFMEDRQRLLTMMEKEGKFGEVKYTSFLAASLDESRYLDGQASRSAFSLLDLDDDGMVRITELMLILQSHRMDEEHRDACWEMDVEKCMRDMDAMASEECQEVLRMYDLDGDQALNYEEFLAMLSSSA